MRDFDPTLSDAKIEKLTSKLAKALHLTYDDAHGIVYEEWDSVERLFQAHGKVKAVLSHLIDEINCTYRIA